MNRFTLAALAVLCLLTSGADLARAEAKGDAILRRAFKSLNAARSFSADLKATLTTPNAPAPVVLSGRILAMKPNFLRVELKGPNAPVFVADGKNYYQYQTGAPVYQKELLRPRPTEFVGLWEGEIDSFFGGEANAAKVGATLIASKLVDGVACDIVKAEMQSPPRTAVYSIGKTDHLIHRAEITMGGAGSPRGGANRPRGGPIRPMEPRPAQPSAQTNVLTSMKLNPPLTASDFVFKPPANTRPLPPPRRPPAEVGRNSHKRNSLVSTGWRFRRPAGSEIAWP